MNNPIIFNFFRSRHQLYDFNPSPGVKTTTAEASTENIKIFSVSQNRQALVSKAIVGGGILAMSLFILCMSSLICYMRSRPEGVYKTNETGQFGV
uniref:Uncharacterized protein n=1 Tax=Caenorhabditis japonica TaxID=281687 RepID=A0A8R1EN71_CAEJA